jgi:hypothetical protein
LPSRPSRRLAGLIALLAAAFLATFADAAWQGWKATGDRRERQDQVRRLGLTDLCLFTEAHYTRHPSQADLHSAFQDHPLALEHFPSGSLLLPSRISPGPYAKVAGPPTVPD